MKQAIWKHLLSYITDVHIESTSSDYNEVLDLYYVKGRYQLCTDKVIYSFADKYDNFLETFKAIDIANRGFKDVLCLGFGLGSIPYMLENYFKVKYNYTGVEIDEEVIYLASKYVLDELKSDVQLIQADANVFMQLDECKYDLICMDIFEDDIVPEAFEDEYFLELMKDSLTDDGLIIFNRLYLHDVDRKTSDAYYHDVFLKVFPHGRTILSGGNLMLLNW